MNYTKADKHFEAISFVAKARSKDTSREVINYIYVDDKYIVATDGHRLHRVVNNNILKPGFYQVIKASKTALHIEPTDYQGHPYPDYNAVMPKIKELLPLTKNTRYPSIPYSQIIRSLDETVTLSYESFLDVIPYVTDFEVNGKNAVMFKNGTKEAVIMPVKC